MANGYIGSSDGAKPDAVWWLERLGEAMKWREETADELNWQTYKNMAEGRWEESSLPVNLTFAFVENLVPRVYFRDPSVSIVASRPGTNYMMFAKMLERTINKLLRQMRVKDEMRKIVKDTILYGTGVGMTNIGAFFEFKHNAAMISNPMRKGMLLETIGNIYPNMPLFARIHPKSYLVPYGTTSFRYATWDAIIFKRDLMEAKNDIRYSDKRRLLKSARFFHGYDNQMKPRMISETRKADNVEETEIAYIRDKRTKKVIILSPQEDVGILGYGPDVLQMEGFPNMHLIFNESTDVFWGISDISTIASTQDQANETNESIKAHERLSKKRFITKKGAFSEATKDVLMGEDDSAVAELESGNDFPSSSVMKVEMGGIDPSLFNAFEHHIRNFRETTGFSRNQIGEFNSQTADTTATEAQIVKQASELRTDSRRDATIEMLLKVVNQIIFYVFYFWRLDDVAEVIGPAGIPVWIQFKPDELKNARYEVKIEPDDNIPETKAVREQRAKELYQILAPNPNIDPLKLTQYLLHNLHGTAFDDMLRQLPPMEGTSPDNPMPIDQYTNNLQGLIGDNRQLLQGPEA